MKNSSFHKLKKCISEDIDNDTEEFVDTDDYDIDEIVDTIIDNLSMFKEITYSKKDETEDYVIITVNANNPLKARADLASQQFSHITNFIIEPMRKTIRDGFQLEVYDEKGDPFEKDIFIRIRRGGQFNAGVQHEIDFIEILQDLKTDKIAFKDTEGNKLVLDGVKKIRDCSKDPGSRMGNRADVEITYAGGKQSRISLKKDSAYKVAGLVRRFASRSYKIGKAVRNYFNENDLIFKEQYITVPITNPALYKWCLFGNDITENGAVIKTTISKDDVQIVGNDAVIKVHELILPTERLSILMKKYPIYLFMAMNKRGAIEVRAAVIGIFGRRYLMPNLIIPEVNDGTTLFESKQLNESNPARYGKYFFHGSQNAEQILKLNPPTPENILFVTADIDYANEYAKRQKNSNSSNIYVVRLKPDAKIFDAKDYDDLYKLTKYPPTVLDFLNFMNYDDEPKDIFTRFQDIAINYPEIKRAGFDKEKYYEELRKHYGTWSNFSDIVSRQLQIFDAVAYYQKRDPSILADHNTYAVITKMRKIFCQDLKEAGYQGFASEEFVWSEKRQTNIASSRVLGIFDIDALESIEPVSIDKKTATSAIRALGRFGKFDGKTGINNKKNYDRSNSRIKKVINPSQNESLEESVKSDYKYSMYCGYNLFTECDDNKKVFTKRIQISNMGNKGKIPVAIVSESDTEVRFKFWKYNESQHCYGPELYDGESIGKIVNIEYGKWVSNGGCGMKPLED